MAEAVATKPPSLSEQYHLEKEEKQATDTKPVEVKEVTPAVTTSTEEVTTEQVKEAPPAEEAVEEKTETPASTEVSSESPAAAEDKAEETPAVEENNEETSEEVPEETPEITLETAPADFRFPTTNQTRHCFTRYIEYHRCVAAKGDDAPECDKFAKFYRSLCPGEWVDKWNEQRENGTFPGPL